MSRVGDILDRIAHAGRVIVGRHKKHADVSLYRTLADCLEIAEACLADPAELAVLNGRIGELARASNRRLYVEKASDVFQRVCRYVFHGEEHTANTNRYAISLREAHASGVRSGQLVQSLINLGGINKFYLGRKNEIESVSAKALRLDRPITHRKDEEIALRLRRLPDNTYEVIEFIRGPS